VIQSDSQIERNDEIIGDEIEIDVLETPEEKYGSCQRENCRQKV
jgi:hypothetical protein